MLRQSVILLLLPFALAVMAAPAATQELYSCVLASQPASLGAGPLYSFQDLTGTDFDLAYMRAMHQQHSDIATLAAFGSVRAISEDLRNFSRKIVRERNDLNAKLAIWYLQVTGVSLPPVSTARIQGIEQDLTSCTPPDLDRQYARTMMSLMAQARDGALLGAQRLTRPEYRNQARLEVRTNQNEMQAFGNWLNTGFLTTSEQQQYYCYNYGFCPYYGYYYW